MSAAGNQLDAADLRDKLPTPAAAVKVANDVAYGRSQNYPLSKLPCAWTTANGTKSWIVRGQNFVISYTHVRGAVTLDVDDCPDDHIVIVLGESVDALISAGGSRHQRVVEPSVVVVPPGPSSVTAKSPCILIRVFSVLSGQFLPAANEDFYAQTDPRIAPFVSWPGPQAGYDLRGYPLSAATPDPTVFGRIYRSSTVMVNLLEPQLGPRDPNRLSPHSHVDFEQCTITVAGDYVHHLRTPWTTRAANWRTDEHIESPSPSITIIPPGVIHTSQAVGEGAHDLIDVFAAPRRDFDAAGWVRNADDYPPLDSP